MTLDWQVLVIAFIALSLQLLAGEPDLRNVEIDGQLPDRNFPGHDFDQNRGGAIDDFQNH